MSLSTTALRSILDSIASRLDESRDTSRYLIGLLVFLGLLGTFWGLLGTIGSISTVIQSLDAGSDSTEDVLSALKEGFRRRCRAWARHFRPRCFGLSGSLILGFLDLQAGRAQNRFYKELENWLSSVTDVGSDIAPALSTRFRRLRRRSCARSPNNLVKISRRGRRQATSAPPPPWRALPKVSRAW